MIVAEAFLGRAWLVEASKRAGLSRRQNIFNAEGTVGCPYEECNDAQITNGEQLGKLTD